MAIKLLFLLVVTFALLYVAQAAPQDGKSSSEEENRLPDMLFIENLDTFPTLISPLEAMKQKDGRSCEPGLCSFLCSLYGFKYGRCRSDNVCVCSNF